jgi:hypothetical protein
MIPLNELRDPNENDNCNEANANGSTTPNRSPGAFDMGHTY